MQSLYLPIAFLLLLFLGSCVNAQRSEESQVPTPTLPVVITSTFTAEAADHIRSTATQVIEVPTPTARATITPIPYPDATPLAKLLLTPEDILAPQVQDMDFVAGIVNSFLQEKSIYIKDKSYDLKADCILECTKQIWGTSHRYLEIQMIRTEDERHASATAEQLFYRLKPYRLEYNSDEYKLWIDAPTQNTHIGISDWNHGFVLATSRGSIVLMIVSYPSPYSDDALHEVSLMAAFSNLQLAKLKQANLIP